MAKPIPDRWLNYSPIGQRVSGTRFVAFKVPLRQHINERVEEHLRLAPESLLDSVPNLGLIIDLTNTNRYYNPSDFNDRNVEHQKLMIPGKMTPAANLSERFCRYVSDYLRENDNNDKLIGVHCTHGVNRTGYMICYFMINVLKMEPDEAIQSFAVARGHEIERNNYIRSLKKMTSNEVVPQPIINWRQQAEEYRKNNADTSENGYGQHHHSTKITNSNRYNSNRSNYGNNNSNYNDRYSRNNSNYQDRNNSNYGNYSNDRHNSNYGNYSNDRHNSNYGNNSRNYGNNTRNYGNNSNDRHNSNYGNNSRNYGNNSRNYGNNSNERYTSNYGNNNNERYNSNYRNNSRDYGNNTSGYGNDRHTSNYGNNSYGNRRNYNEESSSGNDRYTNNYGSNSNTRSNYNNGNDSSSRASYNRYGNSKEMEEYGNRH